MAKQPKSGTKKRRKKRKSTATEREADYTSSGSMGSIVGGFRKAVGAGGGEKNKGSRLGNVIWLLLLAAAAGFVFYRFSQ